MMKKAHYAEVEQMLLKKKSTKLSTISNFQISDWNKMEVKNIDFNVFKPFTFEDNELVLVDTNRECFDEPFLYVGQRDNAKKIIKFNPNLINSTVDQKNITFVFSIGRCGSTLLSKILSALGHFEVSECDVFTRTNNKFAINAALYIFQKFNHSQNSNLSIKFRSGTNKFVGAYIKNFPDANYVFLYRNKLDWAKSFTSKFNHNIDRLVLDYERGYNCLNKLKNSNVKLKVLSYDKIIKEPSLLSSNEHELKLIESVMNKDSQTGVINNKKTQYNENAVNEFLKRVDYSIENLD